jgi:UDPglucose 6-dehydrogenase
VRALMNSLTGKKIALFGFAFKKNTGDTRESAAIKLVKAFLVEGGRVDIYDPQVREETIWQELTAAVVHNGEDRTPSRVIHVLTEVKSRVGVVRSPYDAAAEAAAVVIATEWDVFRCDQMDYRRVYDGMKKPAYLFDGRLVVEEKSLKEIGFKVEIIGKSAEGRYEMF